MNRFSDAAAALHSLDLSSDTRTQFDRIHSPSSSAKNEKEGKNEKDRPLTEREKEFTDLILPRKTVDDRLHFLSLEKLSLLASPEKNTERLAEVDEELQELNKLQTEHSNKG